MTRKKDTMMKNWRTTNRWNGMKQTHTTGSSLDEGGLILSWSIGPTRSFVCWNSSVRRAGGISIAQNDILVRSLKKVAEDAEGENGGWEIKLIIFVGGTSGSVHARTLNDNLKELQACVCVYYCSTYYKAVRECGA